MSPDNSRDRARRISKPTPLNMHTPIGQRLPSRYESSEEEVSGSDTTNRDDHSYSPTDADSDTGESSSHGTLDEDNAPTRRQYTGEKTLSFLTSSKRESYHSSRPPSVYTVRRISGLTLRTQQEDGTSIKTSRSNSPSTTRLSIHRADGTTSSITFEAESRVKRQSCYSEIAPSDDDSGPADTPLVATPITYHAPGSRPNIVSITPPPKSPTQTTKQQPVQQKETSVFRKKSTGGSSNGVSMKARLARLRMAKHQQRLISSLDPDSCPDYSAPVLSPTPKPISAIAGWASKMPVLTSPSALGSQTAKHDLSRGQQPRKGTAKNEHQSPEKGSANNRRSFAESDSQNLLAQERTKRRSYNVYVPSRKPNNESPPLPTKMERRTSSAAVPQITPTSRRSSIRSYYEPQFTPKSSPDRTPTSSNKALPQQQQQQQPEGTQTPTKPRSRTRSISSIASTSSKFSIPAFDAASLKGIAQRYQSRYQNYDLAPPSTSSSSTNSVSGSVSTASLSPDTGRRPSDCSMLSQYSQSSQKSSTYLASRSTTNLSVYTVPPPPPIQESDSRSSSTYIRWSRNPNTSTDQLTIQQPHSRNKSFKWQASSKLGFMLKKRTS